MRRAFPFALAAALAAAPAFAQAPTQGPAQAPPASAATQQRQTDTRVDGALRRVLGVLMQQYGDLTGKIPDSLNDADIAMRDALKALDAGDDATAATAIQKAIEALQKSGHSMSQQLSEQFGSQQDDGQGDQGDQGDMPGDQDGSQPGDQDGNGPGGNWNRDHGWNGRGPGDRRADVRRDPLGRPLRDDGTGQSPDENDVQVPEKMEQARSQAIQEELRRREAEKTRPQPELEYLGRLLQQFSSP
jgi:hypothetical protein